MRTLCPKFFRIPTNHKENIRTRVDVFIPVKKETRKKEIDDRK
jgi:hypothetical protein